MKRCNMALPLQIYMSFSCLLLVVGCSDGHLDGTPAGRACLSTIGPLATHVNRLESGDDKRVILCWVEGGMPFLHTFLITTRNGNFVP
jgi:hypothetical protein